MIAMSAETAERVEKQKAEAVREVQPATKADVDRLFDEIRRLQDTGEQMFKYHGYSGPCPAPPLPKAVTDAERATTRIYDILAGINDAVEIGDDGYARFGSVNDANRLRDLVQEMEPAALDVHNREISREAFLDPSTNLKTDRTRIRASTKEMHDGRPQGRG